MNLLNHDEMTKLKDELSEGGRLENTNIKELYLSNNKVEESKYSKIFDDLKDVLSVY